MDCECALYLFQISFRGKGLKLARLKLPIIQESGHDWDFQKDSAATEHSQHVGELQAFYAYAMQ